MVSSSAAIRLASGLQPRPDLPFELVQATLAAVASGEIEGAFEGLLPELRRWGVKRGALFAREDELRRLAGDDIDPLSARRIQLYDGLDAVGELRLELAAVPPVELLELVEDLFGLGLGRRVRTRELALVRAAVAINAAESFDAALEVLVETCCFLTGSRDTTVTVWDEALGQGTIRAATGEGLKVVGATVTMGNNVAANAVTTGKPSVLRGSHETGLGPRIDKAAAAIGCIVAVPLLVDGVPRITFQATWPTEPPGGAIDRVVAAIQQLGSVTSVAFRAAQERERIAHHDLLQTVLETVPDGVLIKHGDEVTMNPAARRLLGLGPEETTDLHAGFNCRRLDGTVADPAEYPSNLCRTLGRETSARMIVTVAGVDRIFDLRAAPMPNGFVGLLRDVTEEHGEQVVTEQFLERLFESLPLAAVVADASTSEILRVNAAFAELLGYDPTEILGARQPYPWSERDVSPSFDWGDPKGPVDAVLRHENGRPTPVELLPFHVHGADGLPARLVMLARDTSERRNFERQIVQSGKLAAIGELASGVAHEINNPLFAILGLTEFLIRDAEPGSKALERLTLIQQTGLEIKEIVKALLDFARERTDELRPLLVREVVAETVTLLRRTSAAKNVEIVEIVAGEPTHVIGSANQIKQILLNLITNAQQVMPDGGTVTVEVTPAADWVDVTVTDTGPGIPADVLPRIFEPFFTTKRDVGGTGLGLAVSHGIAEMHGGALVARSEPGRGATFSLRLPVLTADEA